jgi:translation initiation factor 2B subunit (eIF-2B alpha/beta/delta family)
MSRVDEVYQTLLANHSSGSSDLLKLTTDWIQAALREGQEESQILRNLDGLCRFHPSMALLQNFSKFFHEIPLSPRRIQAWMKMYLKHEKAACQKFSAHLSNFTNVLVHSFSGLLHQSLKNVPNTLNIFCTESRPVLEGRSFAEKLSRSHHKVYLVADMAAFSVISRVEILAFGCDSITPRGIVNKIGTAAMAEIAQRQGRMNYFIGTTEKVLESWKDDFLLRQGSRDEIYEGDGSVHVENYYFDLTPASYISGLFLETGISRMF